MVRGRTKGWDLGSGPWPEHGQHPEEEGHCQHPEGHPNGHPAATGKEARIYHKLFARVVLFICIGGCSCDQNCWI